jgi:hypothetical protein
MPTTHLSNLQQELLKIFSRDIPEEELKEIRVLLTHYFAKKATGEADKIWDENGYTDELMDEWLNDPDQ